MRQKPPAKEQREMLSSSPHVIKMTDVYVFFFSSFINKFCVDYHAGKTATSSTMVVRKEAIFRYLEILAPMR